MWGTFATLRRILSIITMFIPSMGLFSILHHWRWEQIPFKARVDYAREGFLNSQDKIGLFGFNETIYWTSLDRFDYSDPQDPQPPYYSLYTMISLKETVFSAAALMAGHFILVLIVKILTSEEFRKRGHLINKIIHVIENINYAKPYVDWDEGEQPEQGIQELQGRFRATCVEMGATFCVNLISTALMLVPLWYTGEFGKFDILEFMN